MKILLSFFYLMVILFLTIIATFNITSWKLKRQKKRDSCTLPVAVAGPANTYGGPDPYYHPKIKTVKEYLSPETMKNVYVTDKNRYIVKNYGLSTLGLTHDSVIYCRKSKFRENVSGKFVIVESIKPEMDRLDPFANINFEKTPNLVRKAVAQVTGIYESDANAINQLTENLFRYIHKYAKEHPQYIIDSTNLKKTFANTLLAYPEESDFILTLYIASNNDGYYPVFEAFPQKNIKEVVDYAHNIS